MPSHHTDPPPASGANYIIICSGRIAVKAANDTAEKINAVSMCASRVAQHLEATFEHFNKEHLRPVSSLQHYLMDHMETMGKDEADTKINEMFNMLDALEREYSEHEY